MKIVGKDQSKLSGRCGRSMYAAYYKDKDITILKSKPRSIRKKNKNNERERTMRRFSKISQFTKERKWQLIYPIWRYYPNKNISGHHRFMSMNNKAFDKEGNLAYPENLILTFGILPQNNKTRVSINTKTQTVNIEWEYSLRNARTYDTNQLGYIHLHSKKIYNPVYTDIKRISKHAVITLQNEILAGDYLFVFFYKPKSLIDTDLPQFSINEAYKL